MKNFKIISIVLLSVMLMFTISISVFAADEMGDDIWSDVNVVEGENTENTENTEGAENTVENTNNETENETIFENIDVENEVEEESENEYSNLYNNTNSTTADSENLADTGIADSGMMALIVMVSALVAIYSAKKFNEYKNV